MYSIIAVERCRYYDGLLKIQLVGKRYRADIYMKPILVENNIYFFGRNLYHIIKNNTNTNTSLLK